MNSKERVLTTFQYKEPDRVPCWLGASPEFIHLALSELQLQDEEELLQRFRDDFRRIVTPYRFEDQENINLTPFGIKREGYGYGMAVNHPLSSSEKGEIDSYSWPDPGRVDLSACRKDAEKYFNDYAILGGDWSPFWHDLIDLLGMENMFIKMYMEPELVHSILERIVEYYLEVNMRIFEEAADLFDIFFIGNDFGSSTGSLIDVGLFDIFIKPQLERLVSLGHAYNLKVMLHCCGGFRELIPSMIDSGLDGVHAIQPSCRGMELKKLKYDFGDKIVFNGCIDSHHVLINGSPDFVRNETLKTMDIMKPGGGFIAGASHDYLLETTPVENVLTMFETIQNHGYYE